MWQLPLNLEQWCGCYETETVYFIPVTRHGTDIYAWMTNSQENHLLKCQLKWICRTNIEHGSHLTTVYKYCLLLFILILLKNMHLFFDHHILFKYIFINQAPLWNCILQFRRWEIFPIFVYSRSSDRCIEQRKWK